MTQHTRLTERIARHPLRPRILRLIAELDLETGGLGASPVEVTRRLADVGDDDAPSLGVVAYHVRELARYGGLKAIRTRQVRGSVEHFYAVTPAGVRALVATPLESAIAALETILERYELGALETIPSVALEALEALGRREPSSVAA